mgnify:CR=1 FL=1
MLPSKVPLPLLGIVAFQGYEQLRLLELPRHGTRKQGP